ncbi:MAG TPA: dihydrofolate reductase family protein [Bacteroidales bacterium]|nr:dihydrofolate reductase family protein [Bacteroidales bacterium]
MMEKNSKRKILLDLAVSLDGFIEAKIGEIDWCIMEDYMNFSDFLGRIDTILFGRKSFEAWLSYKPGDNDSDEDISMWKTIVCKEKYVFSKTLTDPYDQVTYIRDRIPEEIRRIKNASGRDIWLYGGSDLITTFMNQGLIDELRLSVHPVILGEGKPLFIDIRERVQLKLIEVKSFSSGVVQLIYHFRKTE